MRLSLIICTELAVYLLLTLPLAFALGGCLTTIALPAVIILGIPLALIACPRIVEVPFLQAEIVSDRNSLERGAWMKGYHLWLPILYQRISRVRLFPSNASLEMYQVRMRGGPPQTIQVGYSIRPSLPLNTPTLPRKNVPPEIVERDRRVCGFLNYSIILPEVWQGYSSKLIERNLRVCLEKLQLCQVHDPIGRDTFLTSELHNRLNAHLAATVEQAVGFSVTINSVTVLGPNDAGMRAWWQHRQQMSALSDEAATMTQEQMLFMAEISKILGGERSAGTDPAILLVLSQLFGGQPGAPKPPAGGTTP